VEIEAAFFETLTDGAVRCRLCPADCRLVEGRRGLCRNRYNRGGKLYSDNYGEAVTLAIDPIEKKPLYHFYPGSDILSTGPNGCNLACAHCQNWGISQRPAATRFISPGDLAELAGQEGSIGVAFTYTEPLIWYEYLIDTAPLLRESGLKVVLVSNGYISREPLERLLPLIDAVNVDLKSIRHRFYARVCKGKIEPILNNIRAFHASGVHLELTNLLIPGLNDSDDDIRELVDFVASVSDLIPLHLSAYHPNYKMDAPATSSDTLIRARDIAAARLKHVFVGNMYLPGSSDSRCPSCGHLLVERSGYRTIVSGLDGSRCEKCGSETGIVV